MVLAIYRKFSFPCLSRFHHLVYIYRPKQIVGMFVLAATMLAGTRAFQKHWPEIVEDIRTGTLNVKVTEPERGSEVEKHLMTPNANQASRVEMECSKEDWPASFIPRLFSQCAFCGVCDVWKHVPVCPCFAAFCRASPHSFHFLCSKRVQS
jgi:hypothetical protein